MRTEKHDPTFYAVIATVRPDLLDFDDIRMLGKALLDAFEPAEPPLPKKVNGHGAVKRRRRGRPRKKA